MAKYEVEIPLELIKELTEFESHKAHEMIVEMVSEAVDYAAAEVEKNAKKVFKNADPVIEGIYKSIPYNSKFDNDTVVASVGFSGYTDDGTPIPLIAMAREYGTSSGEEKKPFVRPAFRKSKINQIMQNVMDKYTEELE